MAPAGGIWAPIAQRILRQAVATSTKISKAVRSHLSSVGKGANAEAQLQPIAVRSSPRHPVHPVAFLRQQKRGAKWYSTSGTSGLHSTLRRYLSTGNSGAARAFDRTAFLKSNVASRAVWQHTGRAPFASTLRPNLTGGALPRTAGGYALPGRAGGARYFSHTPAAPAQVVQNVSQAMRAFWLSGQRARYDGLGPNGEPRYRAVGTLEEEATRKLSSVLANGARIPGSFVDFSLNPTITALSPLAAAFPYPGVYGGLKTEAVTTLGAEGFLDVLSVDFARALKDLSAVMNDLKRLAGLGDLPILLQKGTVLRVRFPGVDADSVERLCNDLGVTRGMVGEDPDFEDTVGAPVALKFPFAPGADADGTITSPGGSMRSHRSELSSVEEDFFDELLEENPWLASTASPDADEEGYASMSPPSPGSGEHSSEDFEGLEGIYRFLEECERAKRRF